MPLLLARSASNISDQTLISMVRSKQPVAEELLLHHASVRRPSLLQHLFELNLELDLKSPMGRTPLMWAVAKGQVQSVQQLLMAGASVHALDAHRWQPLHFVCLVDDEKVATQIAVHLVEFGANLVDGASFPTSVSEMLSEGFQRRERILAVFSALLCPGLSDLIAAYAAPLNLS
jgi:hypothetical protein